MSRHAVVAGMMLAAIELAGTAAAAQTVPPTLAYCSAPSTSPRGPGLIITGIFTTRSDMTFAKNTFTNFLRTTYAPYGNGWVFKEAQVSCVNFLNRRKAEIQRSLDISRVPQPVQSVFHVTFQVG
ncbi:hypothetical protein NYR55_07905 [Sphingomonas sp. BGYR3]|uniref:hypothetical protein n=1 Tax=Sphingomonas sp. BGYR3 TaxID=2975483 RepID=UPI0021A3CB61|nr:hypothetical protein [Sphingomonas sp. BGYR3]MDG5488536.1 hypothetical protein [Sphingomonas sp. BGYR3]